MSLADGLQHLGYAARVSLANLQDTQPITFLRKPSRFSLCSPSLYVPLSLGHMHMHMHMHVCIVVVVVVVVVVVFTKFLLNTEHMAYRLVRSFFSVRARGRNQRDGLRLGFGSERRNELG
jgi:hypothetical protein